MKHLLSVILFALSWVVGIAQTADSHLTFMGIPITGSSGFFLSQLEQKGFTKISEFESSTKLYGKFANEIVELTVLASPRTKTVCKVIVYFPEKNNWSDLRNDYFTKKRLYRGKYLMTDDFEFFSTPYEDGDGYEMRAVAAEKCNYMSFFSEPGGHIYIEICTKKCIKVTYEDDINIKVAKDELDFNAFEDI